jgi:hypothetical protein
MTGKLVSANFPVLVLGPKYRAPVGPKQSSKKMHETGGAVMNNKEKDRYLKLVSGIEKSAVELKEILKNSQYDKLVDQITSLRKEIENEKGLYSGGYRIE